MLPKNCPHCGGKLDDSKIISWGGWTFDENKHQFVPGTPGSSVRLTFLEGSIVGEILRAEGKTVSKDGSLYSVFCEGKHETRWPEMEIVNVYISKVRHKMEKENLLLIETIWGRGYAAVQYNENPVFLYKTNKPKGERVVSKSVANESRKQAWTIQCVDCGHIQSHHKTQGGGQHRKIKECQVEGCNCLQFRKV